MQVAINALLFFLGFSLAVLVSTRPKKTRADIDHFLTNLRYVLDGLKPKAQRFVGIATLKNHEQHQIKRQEQVVFTRAEVEDTFDSSTWQRQAYETMTTLLEPKKHPKRKTFPCIYATMGLRDNEHRYVFLPSAIPSQPPNVRTLAAALEQYLPTSKTVGPNTSLIVICPPTTATRTFEYYNHAFWDLLRGLRIADPSPWPTDIPESTASAKWAFCYGGYPIFPVALTPLYERRHSRWAPSFVVALQPKWVFDQLLGTPEARRMATSKVRSLLKKYDDVEASPDLTAYGDEGTSEVHQLFLRDDNDASMQCPFESMEQATVADLEAQKYA